MSGAQIPPHVKWDKGDFYGLLCGKSQCPEYSLDRCMLAWKLPGNDPPAIPLLCIHTPKSLVTTVEIKSAVRETQKVCVIQQLCCMRPDTLPVMSTLQPSVLVFKLSLVSEPNCPSVSTMSFIFCVLMLRHLSSC